MRLIVEAQLDPEMPSKERDRQLRRVAARISYLLRIKSQGRKVAPEEAIATIANHGNPTVRYPEVLQ